MNEAGIGKLNIIIISNNQTFAIHMLFTLPILNLIQSTHSTNNKLTNNEFWVVHTHTHTHTLMHTHTHTHTHTHSHTHTHAHAHAHTLTHTHTCTHTHTHTHKQTRGSSISHYDIVSIRMRFVTYSKSFKVSHLKLKQRHISEYLNVIFVPFQCISVASDCFIILLV